MLLKWGKWEDKLPLDIRILHNSIKQPEEKKPWKFSLGAKKLSIWFINNLNTFSFTNYFILEDLKAKIVSLWMGKQVGGKLRCLFTLENCKEDFNHYRWVICNTTIISSNWRLRYIHSKKKWLLSGSTFMWMHMSCNLYF